MDSRPLRVAFIHPDLGIGGAERLVVDAALGLQELGHSVDIYTSHHDRNHCFDETKDGTLRVHSINPPFPRSWRGKFHILLAHCRQLHLTQYLLRSSTPQYDVFFVDQLSTCIPFLRELARTRVVFYCHFPDKLLADGEYVEGEAMRRNAGLLKRLYRFPMDWWEELTTKQADVILANSNFTVRVFKAHFPSIQQTPSIVYPGINVAAYEPQPFESSAPDFVQLASGHRPTYLSLNRFEKKKNIALAIDSFAILRSKLPKHPKVVNSRLVIAGGYDPRLEDNLATLDSLVDRAKANSLTYNIVAPSSSLTTIPPFDNTDDNPDILFLLNFTTFQRNILLGSPLTVALLYTPVNEHFGIGPVEGMVCGLPVLACNSGGPTESVVSQPSGKRTGWSCPPNPNTWAEALVEIVELPENELQELKQRAMKRAREMFGMETMAKGLERKLIEVVKEGPIDTLNWVLLFYFMFGILVTLPGRWLVSAFYPR